MTEPLVAIGIATYKRPRYLNDLLKSMERMNHNGFRAHLIVVDNEGSDEVRAIVDRARSYLPISIDYAVEGDRGIASARNLAVKIAFNHNATYLAFVDDDQLVDSDWLFHLVSTAGRFEAAAVLGRWVPKFENGVCGWVKKSGYFSGRPTKLTGTPIRRFATGNVLLSLRELKDVPGPFDTSSNLSGGEDSQLSNELTMRGLRFVHCDESVVWERIPASRATATWMIRRQFQIGVRLGYLATLRHCSLWNRFKQLLIGIGLVGEGSVLAIAKSYRGKSGLVPGLAISAGGLGRIAGLLGKSQWADSYRNTHGE